MPSIRNCWKITAHNIICFFSPHKRRRPRRPPTPPPPEANRDFELISSQSLGSNTRTSTPSNSSIMQSAKYALQTCKKQVRRRRSRQKAGRRAAKTLDQGIAEVRARLDAPDTFANSGIDSSDGHQTNPSRPPSTPVTAPTSPASLSSSVPQMSPLMLPGPAFVFGADGARDDPDDGFSLDKKPATYDGYIRKHGGPGRWIEHQDPCLGSGIRARLSPSSKESPVEPLSLSSSSGESPGESLSSSSDEPPDKRSSSPETSPNEAPSISKEASQPLLLSCWKTLVPHATEPAAAHLPEEDEECEFTESRLVSSSPPSTSFRFIRSWGATQPVSLN